MPSTSGKSYEELLSIKQAKESAGTWNPAGSKSDGKIENALISLRPEGYRASTVQQANAKLASSTQPNTAGLSATGMGLGTGTGAGSLDLNSLYDKYFKTSEITGKQAEATNVEKMRDDAIGSVQNNPWYSQSTRGGKIAAVKSDAERNLTRINSELTRLQTDAEIKYNIQLKQYDINRQEYQDALTLFSTLVNAGALATANGSDIANLSVRTGIPASMINSIVTSAKNKNLTFQTLDDGTGQYIVVLDEQGNVQAKNYLGASKGTGDFDSGKFAQTLLDAANQNGGESYKEVLQAPQFSANPGAVVQYPSGSGVYWTMGADGSWE